MSSDKLPEAFIQQRAVLSREYGAQLPLKVKELAMIWESLDQHEVSWEALGTLHRLAHGLAGSGATFGFEEVSRAARRLEEVVEAVVSAQKPLAPSRQEEIARCITALGDLAAAVAEEALSQAKHQGRDRTVLAEGAPTVLPEVVVVDDDLESRERKGATAVEGAPTARQKVVVIDDEPKILQLVHVLLTENGYEVFTAKTGVSGYDLVVKEAPDAVVSDILLPGLNGFDLCKKIKGNPDLAGIPVILMTAVYKKARYKYEANDAGADALVEKPIDPIGLLRTLITVLEMRGTTSQA